MKEGRQAVMELVLVRHGEARSAIEDPKRALTERGVETVRRMAARAAQAGVKVAQIRHSGKRRAEQTAALMAEQLKPARGMIAIEGLDPEDDVHPLADDLRDAQESVMLVGHLPFLDSLARVLLGGTADASAIRFPPAGIVCLASQDGRWILAWVMVPDPR
jgi:phosphohistidine phosphatase